MKTKLYSFGRAANVRVRSRKPQAQQPKPTPVQHEQRGQTAGNVNPFAVLDRHQITMHGWMSSATP